MSFEQEAGRFRKTFLSLADEIAKVIVGQRETVEGVLTCLFAGGNCLIEGVPGLGKTLLVKTLSQAIDLKFSRIQFTPDLMPADIIGTEIIHIDESGAKSLKFRPGPVFAQVILADEINRATPKTQSALLEAMQEHRVTVGGVTHPLEEPFLVIATENPLEMEGTYLLPEAQLDRFFMKLDVPFSSREDLNSILDRTTGAEEASAHGILDAAGILAARKVVRQVVAAPEVKDYCSRIVLATHPEVAGAPEAARKFLKWGASPRGAQALLLAGKVHALLAERYNVSFHDVQRIALPALRHRIAPNFEAQADGLKEDEILRRILESVPTAEKAMVG
ncbi:MAG TPA: MoxR family ATPase [Planctomycetota bacterium]|nr:MoxR family ATPase [Planctomycetota bacterium]